MEIAQQPKIKEITVKCVNQSFINTHMVLSTYIKDDWYSSFNLGVNAHLKDFAAYLIRRIELVDFSKFRYLSI